MPVSAEVNMLPLLTQRDFSLSLHAPLGQQPSRCDCFVNRHHFRCRSFRTYQTKQEFVSMDQVLTLALRIREILQSRHGQDG